MGHREERGSGGLLNYVIEANYIDTAATASYRGRWLAFADRDSRPQIGYVLRNDTLKG